MIGACRRLWWGETLTVTGQVVGLDNMSLQLPRCEVPIYVATKGPKTLKLTAELADGHLDGPMVPAAAMANHKAAIQSVGPKAGFRFAAYIFCSFAGDRPSARASVRSDPFFLYLLQLDQTDFKESGLDPDLRARIVATAKAGDLGGAAMLVPDDVLDRFVLCGTEHEVVDQLGAYVQAGLDEPILQPLKPSPAAFQSAINAGRAYLR
jgi:alkanesulfonate monooxygenase SsuD/methylene tetrahydromethanopterin reductase-like flavin-dependent oxidoreductase (luciferase family)